MCRRLQIGDVEIAWCSIEPGGRLCRREREEQAVQHLVRQLYGPAAVKTNTPSGAPVVMIGADMAWPCSISHCATMAVVAKAPYIVGVDIETERQQLARVARRFVNEGEEALGLLKVWTLKEAIYKAAGKAGLALTDISLLTSPATAGGSEFKILYSGYLDGEVFMSLVAHI